MGEIKQKEKKTASIHCKEQQLEKLEKCKMSTTNKKQQKQPDANYS